VRETLDVVWHLVTDEAVRVERLVARHIAFGKSPDEARAWVERVDAANARLVEAARERADQVIELSVQVS
jgi:uridine kinase